MFSKSKQKIHPIQNLEDVIHKIEELVLKKMLQLYPDPASEYLRYDMEIKLGCMMILSGIERGARANLTDLSSDEMVDEVLDKIKMMSIEKKKNEHAERKKYLIGNQVLFKALKSKNTRCSFLLSRIFRLDRKLS